MASAHRSGFIGLIGRPNVGKSTMLNYFLNEKIAIVSPRPQTTRHRILGVVTRPDAQLIFLDTPGLHAPEHALGRAMVQAAGAVLEEADVLVTVVDGRRGLTQDDERVFERVRSVLRHPSPSGASRTALLAINKVDLAKKPLLLPLIESCAKLNLFRECIPVSAVTGEQMDVLLGKIVEALPEGPAWYEPQQRTDQSTRQRIAELIREQALLATRQEVPHAVAVLVEQLEERERLTEIQATIFVEREGQKAILIGRGGSMLKQIGQQARLEIERLLGRHVFLGLWVKVVPDWREDERLLRELGYAGAGG